MVTITNGKVSRYVSVGAFNTIYKHNGYKIVNDTKAEPVTTNDTNKVAEDSVSKDVIHETGKLADTVGNNTEEDWVTELLEKPISQWSKDETASFAKEKGIDTSSAHKLSEAKDIIKDWLDEQNR